MKNITKNVSSFSLKPANNLEQFSLPGKRMLTSCFVRYWKKESDHNSSRHVRYRQYNPGQIQSLGDFLPTIPASHYFRNIAGGACFCVSSEVCDYLMSIQRDTTSCL